MRAHQIMTRPVITIAPDATILEAADTMLRRHVSGLPVVDATSKLVGIVSEGDFIRRSEIGTRRRRNRWLRFLLGAGAAANDYVQEHGRKVSEVMTSKPITIVVPYSAGGPVDNYIRAFGTKLAESVKQPVIIINKPGAMKLK